jgi:hypothetical protein
MAPITWRNVGTPNFGDSVAALGMSGRFLDRAFSGLGEGLGQFDNWRTEQNDRLAVGAASQIQDPAAYRQALMDGTAMGGLQPGQISTRTAMALDGRASDLIGRASASDTLQNTRTDRTAEEGARQAVAAIQRAALAGNDAEVARLTALHGAAIGALPTAAQGQILDRASGLIRDNAGIAQTRTQTATGQFNLDRARSTEADQQAAQAVAMRIREVGWDNEGAQEILRNANLNPRARALVVDAARAAGFTGILPNAYTDGGTPAPAAVAGAARAPGSPGAGTREGSPYDVTYQHRATERPITATRMGEIQELQNGMIRTQGASPLGAFQINRATLAQFARQTLGDNWREQEFTPENQERIAEAIYNARRGGDLTTTWAALRGNIPGTNTPANTAGAWRDVPWSVARTLISRAEVGRGVSEAAGEVTAARELQQGIEQRRGQNRAGTIMGDYAALQQDNRPATAVANDLTRAASGTGQNATTAGVLAGMDPIAVQAEISRLMATPQARAARVTPAMVGAMIAQNVTATTGEWNPFVGPGRSFDTAANDADLLRLTDSSSDARGIRGDSVNDARVAATSASITNASERVGNIATEIRRLEQAANAPSAPPELQRTLARRYVALEEARRNLRDLTERNRGDATILPVGANLPGNERAVPRGSAAAATLAPRDAIRDAVNPSAPRPASSLGSAGSVYARQSASPPPTAAQIAIAESRAIASPVDQWVANNALSILPERELQRAAARLNVDIRDLRRMLEAERNAGSSAAR